MTHEKAATTVLCNVWRKGEHPSEVRIGSHSRLSSRHCQKAYYCGGRMQSAHQTTKSRASWKLCSWDSETQETDYSKIGSRQTNRDESFTTLDIPCNGCKAATAVLQHLPSIGTTGLLVIPCSTEVLNGRMLVVTQSLCCIQLCSSRDCSAPGSLVLHYLLEFAQIHVYGKTIILSVSWGEKNMILKHLKHTHTQIKPSVHRDLEYNEEAFQHRMWWESGFLSLRSSGALRRTGFHLF